MLEERHDALGVLLGVDRVAGGRGRAWEKRTRGAEERREGNRMREREKKSLNSKPFEDCVRDRAIYPFYDLI